jgi:integrase
MPKLSVEACAAAPLAEHGKTRKLSDGGGLFLLITDAAKGWRFRYTKPGGKDALMSLGVYPTVTLARARELAADYRSKLGRGENLTEVRRREIDTTKPLTFGQAAAEYNARRARGEDPKGAVDEKTLAHDARGFRYSKRLHGMTFAEIKRKDLVDVCNVYAAAGKRETAKRMGGWFQRVWRFAYDQDYIAPGVPDVTQQGGPLGKSLPAVRTKHRPAMIDTKAIGALMRVICVDHWVDSYITVGVSRALQLAIRTAARAGNVFAAEWSEFDLEGSWPQHHGHATWVIPVRKMKMKDENRTDHIVPLSTQMVASLREHHKLTGHLRWVFPGARSDATHLSNNAMSSALRSLGYAGQQTQHGFRTTFKTLAGDLLKADWEVTERQLAHKIGNDVAGAYDRSQRLEERRKLMQDYSDLLDKLRDN